MKYSIVDVKFDEEFKSELRIRLPRKQNPKKCKNDRKMFVKSKKNVQKRHFVEKPSMKDFKNSEFYIPKSIKQIAEKKLDVCNSNFNNKYIQAGCAFRISNSSK